MAAGRGRRRRVTMPGVAELLRPAAPAPDGGDDRQASGRETIAVLRADLDARGENSLPARRPGLGRGAAPDGGAHRSP